QSLASLIGGAPHSSSVKRLVSLVRPGAVSPGLDASGSGSVSGEKLVKQLVKRLRRPELVKALERAVSEASPHSGCVTAAVAQGDPEPGHVTACRLWRWPDLQSAQELRPLENCQMPYTARTQTELCVNPQHYTRLPLCSPAQDPVLVCRPGTPAGSSGVGMGSASSAGGPADDPNAASPSVSIGSGVGLYYVNGEVHVECLSDSPIFVQSPNGNLRQNWHAATVCRIPPGCNLCVFSNADFGSQLRQSAQQGFDEVYALTKMCTIRIAFVKGWGSDYRRQLVTATPCWIEVHLNGPLLWLDQVLAAIGSPTYVSIGSGVGLYYVNGEVHVECLSDSPIFVQSPNGNLRQNWHAATVCRIPPGCNLCVFSNADFGSQLRQSAQQGFDEVYALTKMCTIRIAFVKGWGSDYRRQLVTATPCWRGAPERAAALAGPGAGSSPTYVCSSMS
uniref:Mothers against decapentaplegic homolog n=1 Tax=Macrostomum lignano TaxID=282301 RepID=A0A1I8H0F8_9PLAT